jgi:hypothetical protein
MKNFTIKLFALTAFVLLTYAAKAQVTYQDDFSTVRNYLTEGVTGTIWDALIVNDTIEGSGAPAGQLFRIDTDTVPGTLTIRSSNTTWGGPNCNGVLLCKVLPADHSFTATVKIVGGDLNSWNGALDYMCSGLLVRNPDVNAADFVDVWAFDRSNWTAVHLFEDWDDDTETETATADAVSILDNPWLKLERVGNDFTGYWGPDGAAWTELQSVTRDDLAGMELQVGIAHSLNTANIGHALFDDFKLVDNDSIGGTAIENVDLNNNLSVFYKPIQRSIVVSLVNDQIINSVQLVSMDGKMITKLIGTGNRIEIAAPQNGLYIVLVESNGNTLAKKIIIR